MKIEDIEVYIDTFDEYPSEDFIVESDMIDRMLEEDATQEEIFAAQDVLYLSRK